MAIQRQLSSNGCCTRVSTDCYVSWRIRLIFIIYTSLTSDILLVSMASHVLKPTCTFPEARQMLFTISLWCVHPLSRWKCTLHSRKPLKDRITMVGPHVAVGHTILFISLQGSRYSPHDLHLYGPIPLSRHKLRQQPCDPRGVLVRTCD
jgi:hypothetical protein